VGCGCGGAQGRGEGLCLGMEKGEEGKKFRKEQKEKKEGGEGSPVAAEGRTLLIMILLVSAWKAL